MSPRRQIARADRVLHGLWRLRLPLPWPGVPHVHAWAISGVPDSVITQAYEPRRGQPLGVDRFVEPDRDLVPGTEVETDLGRWQVYETPGHAPSHVCLHQPDRRLLVSGDHLLGRISLYYDFGYTPDPAGEYLESLDVVDRLDSDL